MKKVILLSVIVLGSLFFSQADAQVRVNINIGLQPVWGPVGYDYVDYYYLPDLDCYYYVPSHQFIVLDNNRWIYVNSLPPRYGRIDLYSARKIVINGQRPYLRNQYYHNLYARNRGYNNRMNIRDSRDSRYYVIPDHPMHNQWERGQSGKGNNGNHYGQMKGNNGNHYGQMKGNYGNDYRQEKGNNGKHNGQNKGNKGNNGNDERGNNGRGKNK